MTAHRAHLTARKALNQIREAHGLAIGSAYAYNTLASHAITLLLARTEDDLASIIPFLQDLTNPPDTEGTP